MEVDKKKLQILFDVAVSTMYLGPSHSFDDEEVVALRSIAVALGVDPMVATPQEFRCKYGGKHEPRGGACRYCNKILKGNP